MTLIRSFLIIFLFFPIGINAAGVEVQLDKAPIDTSDNDSIKRGAQSFVHYCLTCHGASFMRYNRHQDVGFTNQELLDNLIQTGQKVGDLMVSAMKKNEAEGWFGVAPPDLSVIARSRGADWLYTYLRSFYRDETTATGWNNLIFDKVAMPHVFYELQGQQILKVKSLGDGKESKTLELAVPGSIPKAEYDKFVADLVNYMVYLGEPHAAHRVDLGIKVMLFLFAMLGLTYLLYKEYWRDIH